MGVRLFVGAANAGSVKGDPFDLTGDLEYSGVQHPQKLRDISRIRGFLDSGAFTDVRRRRVTPEEALERQLRWEAGTARLSGCPGWRVEALVSYDELIDEKPLPGGGRVKQRWTVKEAERAVASTVAAASYLDSQRARLAPRTLVLSAQGVDAEQYRDCAVEVLRCARPGDWFGLGGWCILGRNRRWLPEFWRTLDHVLPLVRLAGLSHVHLFGVLWLPALGGLLYLADRHGLMVSTDSAKPVLDCTMPDPKKAGVRCPYWKDNVAWWREALAGLRATPYYRAPVVQTRLEFA